MEAEVGQLLHRLLALGRPWAYLALGLSAFLENVLPPVPGDTVVVFSAYLVGRGYLGGWLVYLATWLGGTLGFLTMYAIGYTGGRAWLSRHQGRFFTAEKLERAERWLGRYGLFLILANRFLSGVRSVIAVTAGVVHMSWPRVAVGAAVSMAVWNGLLLALGLRVGRDWESLVDCLHAYDRLVLGLAVFLVGAWIVLKWKRARCASGSEP